MVSRLRDEKGDEIGGARWQGTELRFSLCIEYGSRLSGPPTNATDEEGVAGRFQPRKQLLEPLASGKKAKTVRAGEGLLEAMGKAPSKAPQGRYVVNRLLP
jgi:hypothetical protein